MFDSVGKYGNLYGFVQDGDPESLTTAVSGACMSAAESEYIISKLITMTVSQATLAAQKQAAIAELENRMKQVHHQYFIIRA
jgi:hypothetical protein